MSLFTLGYTASSGNVQRYTVVQDHLRSSKLVKFFSYYFFYVATDFYTVNKALCEIDVRPTNRTKALV